MMRGVRSGYKRQIHFLLNGGKAFQSVKYSPNRSGESSLGMVRAFNRCRNLLDGAGHFSQAATAARIFHFAGAKTALDFRFDSFQNLRGTVRLDVPSNIFPGVVEAVAEWNRIFCFLDANPHLHIQLPEQRFAGKIDDVAVRGPAKRKWLRYRYPRVVSNQALDCERGHALSFVAAGGTETQPVGLRGAGPILRGRTTTGHPEYPSDFFEATSEQ